MDIVKVVDCTGAALSNVAPPQGALMAGYTTGSGAVPWTAAQFAAHPGAVRINQSPRGAAADPTADVFDVEPQAGTIDGIPEWVHQAWTSYRTARRPGQRTPCLYLNTSELTPAANALNAAGITSGVSIWLAAPMSEQAATETLASAGGPFPIIGVQYAFYTGYDVSLFSAEWLNNISKAAPGVPAGPGTQSGWRFCCKCQSLFYGPGQANSFCPMNGRHDGSKSHDYTLGYTS